MKVYIVTSGDYSDYGIESIFSTRLKAQLYINYINNANKNNKRYRCSKFNDIELFEVNKGFSHVKSKSLHYRGHMDIDGNIRGNISCDSDIVYFPLNFFNITQGKDESLTLYFNVIGKSEKHVIKIVNDKRAQLISSNMFVKGYRENC